MSSTNLGIGIDTGGTFTDSVIVDLETVEVIAKSKSLTTRHDLKVGIANSLSSLDSALLEKVKLVALSSTLATNSIVEGKGSRVGLIVTVPNPETFRLPAPLPADRVAVLAGAHDKNGQVTEELDLEAAKRTVDEMACSVDAFAVSSFFSIYNSEFELELKDVIGAQTECPVICGSELSGSVGMVERAVTASLNARLLPLMNELLEAVKATLVSLQIEAPLMVVKGDGSLISQEVAKARPVETLLSGPAASVVGACTLAGFGDAIVVDMGGTTTDIAVVTAGQASVNEEGANIGGWQTRVKAVDMWTLGLGGDSRVAVKSDGSLKVGPRRAIPLCLAAKSHPEMTSFVNHLTKESGKRFALLELDFLTLVKKPNFHLTKYEAALVEALDGQVLHREQIDREVSPFVLVDRLVGLGYVAEVSFTPTDMLHANGTLGFWDVEASEAGAEFLARKAGVGKADFLHKVYGEVTAALKLNIFTKAMLEEQDRGVSIIDNAFFLDYLMRLNGQKDFGVDFKLKRPLIAVGAPASQYFPSPCAQLGADLTVPEHAEVANAVGAIAGKVIERAEAVVRPDRPFGYVVDVLGDQKRFKELDEAVSFAEEYVRSVAERLAALSGGTNIQTRTKQLKETVSLATGWGDPVLLELKVLATAVGTPGSWSGLDPTRSREIGGFLC